MAGRASSKSATEKGRTGTSRQGAGRTRTASRARILAAVMDEAALKGWNGLSMSAIAGRAGMTVQALRADYPDRSAFLAALNDEIDAAMLAEGPAEPDEPARDSLFELLMRRFDALAPYKEGLRALYNSRPSAPLSLLYSGFRLHRSMGWVLDAAGIGAHGPLGHFRRSGLLAIYAATMHDWLNDSSPDHASTMAALDKRLKRADRMIARCRRRRENSRNRGAVATEAA